MNMRCEAETAFICTAGFGAFPLREVMSEAWKIGRHARMASLYLTNFPDKQRANRGSYLHAAKKTENHICCLINEASG